MTFLTLRKSYSVILFVLLSLLPSFVHASPEVKVLSETEWISAQIFQNECSSQVECLTSWNEGEDFPSLGIGHFIWYREGHQGRFVESFPGLLKYMEVKGVEIPDWFKEKKHQHAPWKGKKQFKKELRKKKLRWLRNFLLETKSVQAEYMAERLLVALPAILRAAPEASKLDLRQKLSYLIHSENGLYPLIDYVNFNGEGLSESERFNHQGWGLMQVLEAMKKPEPGDDFAAEFSKAADLILERRVKNAPRERNEQRWLEGWKNRMLTYRVPDQTVRIVERNRRLREKLMIAVIQDMPMTQNIYLADLDEAFPSSVPISASKA